MDGHRGSLAATTNPLRPVWHVNLWAINVAWRRQVLSLCRLTDFVAAALHWCRGWRVMVVMLMARLKRCYRWSDGKVWKWRRVYTKNGYVTTEPCNQHLSAIAIARNSSKEIEGQCRTCLLLQKKQAPLLRSWDLKVRPPSVVHINTIMSHLLIMNRICYHLSLCL